MERHAHSENWLGPGGVPVQFTDDPAFENAIAEASAEPFETGVIRVASVRRLVESKLRAPGDPARRRSRRLQDLVDAVALLEDHPEVETELTAAEREQLRRA